MEKALDARTVARFRFNRCQTINTVCGQRGVVLIFFNKGNCIDAKTGDAFIQPPVNHGVDFLAQLRVFPVEIRLLFMKNVQIVALLASDFFPRAAAKNRSPVIGRAARRGGFKDVIITIFRLRVGQRGLKPGVFIAGMVNHQVDHYLNAQLASLFNQVINVLHLA